MKTWGATEELKMNDYLSWVNLMNNIDMAIDKQLDYIDCIMLKQVMIVSERLLFSAFIEIL